ncbi:MAG TPA: exosortase-associated EpsI family protein [Opitutaceae bacterium]
MQSIAESAQGAALPQSETLTEAWPARVIALVALLTTLLAIAVGLQFVSPNHKAVVARSASLDLYLPAQTAGWESEDHPLGDTENLSAVVKTTLNYDEALLRTYHKGPRQFTVYIAYWAAGKMSSREVAYHTPDICWPAAGWERIQSNEAYPVPGFKFAPAQYREFVLNGQQVQVLFWHTYDGKTIAYDPNGRPSRASMLTDLMSRGLAQKGEQYFIRITSPKGFEDLWNDDGFREVMELIGPLGPGLSNRLEGFELGQ